MDYQNLLSVQRQMWMIENGQKLIAFRMQPNQRLVQIRVARHLLAKCFEMAADHCRSRLRWLLSTHLQTFVNLPERVLGEFLHRAMLRRDKPLPVADSRTP